MLEVLSKKLNFGDFETIRALKHSLSLTDLNSIKSIIGICGEFSYFGPLPPPKIGKRLAC